MRRLILFLFALSLAATAAERRAKNVILFLGDAAGIPTINAASIYGYNEPQKLFLQKMPHIGLMDTSTASNWVTDSAAGMTAIVTGEKTHNGVLSQGPDSIRGKKDGTDLKTILEYAEERGLATGVVSNMEIVDATPAACYAHVNDRSKYGEIFLQALKPLYGDGVDVMIGAGRGEIFEGTRKLGVDLKAEMKAKGRPLYGSLNEIPPGARRAIVLFEHGDFDIDLATQRAIEILSRNRKGYFLMVEQDCHTDRIVQGLKNVLTLDGMIHRTVDRVRNQDTLVIFTADHSFDLRISGGSPKSRPLISDEDQRKPQPEGETVHLGGVRMQDNHTGEEVLVSAEGPGSERVYGFLLNTDLFHIMLEAYGWNVAPSNGKRTETSQKTIVR